MADAESRAESIFFAALERASPAERERYIAEACTGDVELQRRVERLLGAQFKIGNFLEAPLSAELNDLVADVARGNAVASDEYINATIGPYKLLEQIGGGGMGVVYMAEQTHPVRRLVALKIIKPGMDSGQVIARFEAERQALTMMDHPNIAKVLDAGTTDAGRPYFVMELVKGIPITDYCDQARLDTDQRLRLFIQVCQAVQHAHQKGVIHRDLKPTNVLVTLHDDKPVPKVIDFGIAKAAGQVLTDKTLFTNFAQMLGTPLYMSPEQAQLSGLDVDTRSDVYSLGVLLYELLTGTTPFEKQRLAEAAYDEMRRIIREEDPPRPSMRLSTMGDRIASVSALRHTEPKKLGQLVRGELDWIVMRSLEKDRSRRYETANGLCRDVERYLNDEAVHACPPSRSYRFRKLLRRHKGPVLAGALVLLVLLSGIVGTTWGLIRANASRADAVREAAERAVALAAAQQSDRAKAEQLWHALVAQARANRMSGRPGRRFETLETLKRATALAQTLNLPADNFLELRNAVIATLAFPDLVLGPPWLPRSEADAGYDADETHTIYARNDWDGNTSIRRVADDVELYHLPGQGGPASSHFSRDGKYISIVHCDQEGTSRVVEVWRLDGSTGQRLLNEADAHCPDFLRSEQVAVSYHDGSIRVFELPSGRELHRLPPAILKRELVVAQNPVEPLLAASSYFNSVVQIRELRTGQVLASLPQDDAPVSICWDPGGRMLAVGYGSTAPIRLYDRIALPSYKTFKTSTSGTYVSFNSTGDRLLSISWESILELFDVGTGQRLLVSPRNCAWNRLNADNTRHFGGVEQRRVGFWDLADGREYRKLVRRDSTDNDEFFPGAVSPDGRLLAVSVTNGIGLWDLETGSQVGLVPAAEGEEIRALFQPTGSLLTLMPSGLLRWPIAYDPKTGGNPIAGPPERLGLPFGNGLAQSADGRIIVSCDRKVGDTKRHAGGWILHTDRAGGPGQMLHVDAGRDIGWILISPDGRWVFTIDHINGLVNVFDARDGALVKSIARGGGFVDWPTTASCFTPDGRWMSSGADSRHLIEVGTWKTGPQLPGMAQYAPAGNLFAVATTAGIRLFDQTTNRELAMLEDPSLDFAKQILFTPDASKLIAINRKSGIRVWDLRLIRRQLKTMGLDWQSSEEMEASAPR